jgi:hypothetical protein
MAFALISLLSATAVGLVAWREWWFVGLTLIVPVLVGLQSRRTFAFAVATAYFGAASRDLIPVYATFTAQPVLRGVLGWLIATLILAAPFTLAWTENRAALAWRIPIALLSAAVPPLGLIAWASPLMSAGVLFPGTAWLGLSVTAVAPGLLPARPRMAGFAVVLICAVSWLIYVPANPSANWQAISTSFVANETEELRTADRLHVALLSSGAKVTVFPESVIKRWTEATELFWEPTIKTLNVRHRFAIVGAGLPIGASADFLNAAVIIGGPTQRAFVQRVPVPIGMWRPFTGEPTVPLRLTGPATMDVAGERVAFLICYGATPGLAHRPVRS